MIFTDDWFSLTILLKSAENLLIEETVLNEKESQNDPHLLIKPYLLLLPTTTAQCFRFSSDILDILVQNIHIFGFPLCYET